MPLRSHHAAHFSNYVSHLIACRCCFLKEKIVELSYKPEFGAREMRRVIQDKVEDVVASALLSDKIKKGDKIEINPETFEIIVNPVK